MAYEDTYSDEFDTSYEDDTQNEDINTDASYRIGTATFFLMISLALFFDIAQIVITILSFGTIGAIISPILSGLAWFLFYIWFKMKSIDLMSSRRFVRNILTGLAELIPYIDLLPMWTTTIILTTRETRKEDRRRTENNVFV